MSEVEHFEMAYADDPEDLIKASQRSVIAAMKGVVADVRKTTDAPGMTWEQIDYLFDRFKDKQPKIIHQKEVL